MELFKSFSNVTFTHVEHTNAAAKDDDVLVLYDMWQKIDQAAQTNFVNLVTSDKGVVALHNSIANYNEWDTYAYENPNYRHLVHQAIRWVALLE